MDCEIQQFLQNSGDSYETYENHGSSRINHDKPSYETYETLKIMGVV
jgi:hypothetical protein